MNLRIKPPLAILALVLIAPGDLKSAEPYIEDVINPTDQQRIVTGSNIQVGVQMNRREQGANLIISWYRADGALANQTAPRAAEQPPQITFIGTAVPAINPPPGAPPGDVSFIIRVSYVAANGRVLDEFDRRVVVVP